MRALFVTNQRKTAFYDVIARRMGQLGIDVHWISVSNRWTEFLLGQGWARDAILSLADFGEEWSRPYVPNAEDEARAARIEADGETSLKNVLMMDRELNRQRGLDSEAYVHVVTREIERFVRDKGIRVGFGEPTWAPEMLASLVLEANGGRYYMHHTIRVPSERFGFFRGIFHDRLEKITAPTDEHRALARDAIKAVRERGARNDWKAQASHPAEDTLRLLAEGRTFEEIAQIRGRRVQAVIGLVAKLIERGDAEFQPEWLAPDRYTQIAAACRPLGMDRLKPLKEALPPEITYEEIKLVMAHLRSQNILR